MVLCGLGGFFSFGSSVFWKKWWWFRKRRMEEVELIYIIIVYGYWLGLGFLREDGKSSRASGIFGE